MSGNARSAGVTVTSRVLALLGAFDDRHHSLTLTELARRAELAVPTAHRIVAELADWGALQRDGSGRYQIGRRLWDLGLLAPIHSDLQQIASPFLQDLYAATLATVHLAVRDGDQVLYIDRLSGHASVPVVSTVGSRLPLYATGVGKVLLAYAPAEVRQRVLTSLRRVTPYTITQPGRLQAQLRRVPTDGFAQTADEMSLGASSVAVPVRSPDARVIAALGVVVPALKRDRARLVAALGVAAHGISRTLAVTPTI